MNKNTSTMIRYCLPTTLCVRLKRKYLVQSVRSSGTESRPSSLANG